MSGNTKTFSVFVPVQQECMGQVIGKRRWNINRIQQNTTTNIYSYNAGDCPGRGSGFIVTGSEANCAAAREAIQSCEVNTTITISELVPQRFVGLLIRRGRDNFRQIEAECDVKITWPKFSGTEKHVIFDINGSRVNCERAREMLKTNIENWKKNKASQKTAPQVASGSRNEPKEKWKKNEVSQKTAPQVHSRSQNDSKMDKRKVPILKKFTGLINGAKGHAIEKLKTCSGANIWFPKLSSQPRGEMAIVIVEGSSEDCDKAEMLIKDKILSAIEHKRREELGGDVQFVCFSCTDAKTEFELVKCGNDSSARSKYRVESDDCQKKNELFSRQTIASVKCHLSKSLQTLHELKDDKELTVDFWCHFCKIGLENVQEDEANETVTGEYINRRIGNVCCADDKEAINWKASFGEFVDPSEVNIGTLSESNDSEDELLKHAQTLWRYDYGFITPTGLEIRLKAWQGLPAGRNEPPDEVKNLLKQVFFKGEEGNDVKAWLCYPSTTVIRGDIMTPFSKYDCRIKLRAGPRRVNENGINQEELDILAEYLSNCAIDKSNHKLVLPDENYYKIPKDFLCKFYREVNEKKFYVDMDDERYSVIVFDEKGWDSRLSKKTDKKEFGIRVTMNSLSTALLSPERNWEPEEILSKLDNYMDFLSVLNEHLFD